MRTPCWRRLRELPKLQSAGRPRVGDLLAGSRSQKLERGAALCSAFQRALLGQDLPKTMPLLDMACPNSLGLALTQLLHKPGMQHVGSL